MQTAADSWQPQPDQLLERVMERARTLLAAERVQLGRQADEARLAAMATVIATQSRTIDDLTVACAVLHAQAEADAARLAERDATVAALEHHLREVHRSTSWRVTRPLRALRHRARPSYGA